MILIALARLAAQAILALATLTSEANVALFTITGCDRPAWSQQTFTLTCGGAVVQPPDPPHPPGGVWNGTCPGFDAVNYVEWSWASTPDYIDLRITPNAIAVVAFVATPPADLNNMTNVSATGYPAPNLINYLTLSLSDKPCDLYPAAPGSSSSASPTVAYGIGTIPTDRASGKPLGVALQPGQRYYLNIAARDAYGQQTCLNLPARWNCDVRLSLQKPPGH